MTDHVQFKITYLVKCGAISKILAPVKSLFSYNNFISMALFTSSSFIFLQSNATWSKKVQL